MPIRSAEVIDLPEPTGSTGTGDLQRQQARKQTNLAAVKAAIAANVAKLAKKGVMPVSALGDGQNGIAFKLREPGKVLKVTADKTEAVASFKIMGRRLKHVCNIVDVFRFPDSDVFGIVQEQLQPLSQQEKSEIHRAMAIVDRALPQTNSGMSGSKTQVDTRKYHNGWASFVKEVLAGADDRYGPEDLQDQLAVLKKYDIDKMMDELYQRGIGFHDYHAGNIMKRGSGTYVIADLGVSYVPDGVEPPVMERVNEAAAHPQVLLKRDLEAAGTFEDVLLANKDKLIKNDLRPYKPIGTGTRGVAYLCKNGDVLKVTLDKDEALASMKVMGKQVPGVIEIKRVFSFPTHGGNQFYGIVQEQLTPLHPQENKIFRSASRIIEKLFDGNMDCYRWGWQEFLDITDHKLKQDGLSSQDDEYVNVVRAVRVFKKFGVDKMMDGLYGAGVLFHDYHEGNIMRRKNGEYVVIDLGASHVEGVAAPPLLEGLANRVVAVYGGMQPLSKRQAEFVRNLGKGASKVLLCLSGGKIPFDSMREIAEASFADMEGKVEIYDCSGQGVVQALEAAEAKGSSALRPGVAFELYTAEDKASVEQELQQSGLFTDSAVLVKPLDPKIADDMEAVAAVRKGGAKDVLDPHVFSDPARAQSIVSLLGTGSVREVVDRVFRRLFIERELSDMGGVKGAEKVIEFNRTALMNHIDMKTLNFLGAGSKGAVFDIGGNKVLKITSDLKDVSSALKLKGKSLKHVTKIHDVFELNAPPDINVEVFGMVSDKVEILSEDEQDEFNRFFSMVRESPDADKLLSMLAAGRMDDFFDAFRQAQVEELMGDAMGGTDPDTPAGRKLRARVNANVETRARGLWDVMRKFKIGEMVEELASNGILYADYKGDNLGKRGQDYVLLDVGGRSDGGRPPKLGGPGGAPTEGLVREGRYPLVPPPDHDPDSDWFWEVGQKIWAEIPESARTWDRTYDDDVRYEIVGMIRRVVEQGRNDGLRWSEVSGRITLTRLDPSRIIQRGDWAHDGAELVASLKRYRDLPPIIVGRVDGRDYVMNGHHRIRASQASGRPVLALVGELVDGSPGLEFTTKLDEMVKESAPLRGPSGKWPIADALADHEKARAKIPTKTIPAGTIMYHGSTMEHIEPRRYLSLTSTEKAAANWVRDEHGTDPHVLKFRFTRDVQLLDWPSEGDNLRNAEWWIWTLTKTSAAMLGAARAPEVWDAIEKLGYDGIWLESIDAGHDEVMLFEPTDKLTVVKAVNESVVTEMTTGNMVRLLGLTPEEAEEIRKIAPGLGFVARLYVNFKKWRMKRGAPHDVLTFRLFQGDALEEYIQIVRKYPKLDKMLSAEKDLSDQSVDRIINVYLADKRGPLTHTNEPLLSYPDGSYWVELTSDECSAEGESMAHCGVADGKMFSYRTKEGKPRVTVDVIDRMEPQGEHATRAALYYLGLKSFPRKVKSLMIQVRGKANTPVPHELMRHVSDLARELGAVYADISVSISDKEFADAVRMTYEAATGQKPPPAPADVTQVTQEALDALFQGGAMASGKDFQSSPWSTGANVNLDFIDPEDRGSDKELVRRRLGMIVQGIMDDIESKDG
jgi:hypothetical protein